MESFTYRRILAVATLFVFLAATATATDLQNIEKITPQGSQNINITGTIDMKGNPITDTSGNLTLNGGNVEIPNGNLNVGNSISGASGSLSMSNEDYWWISAEGNLQLVTGGSGGDSFQVRDPHHGTWMLEMSEGGPYSFKNSVSGEVMLQMNNSIGSDISIPNGNLDISGETDGVDLDNPGTAITVNSNQYEVADNSISVTELDTGSTDSRYFNRDGDSINGTLDMTSNRIENVSELDVSTSDTQIASFSDTGIAFNQPLSLDSSGPLSVSNGVELTGTSSNTLESYSTLYLETSSGSPSDIVLDPSGEVGIDSNLNLGENDIDNVNCLGDECDL